MKPQNPKIGLIGDYRPSVAAHIAIPKALSLAATSLGCGVECSWIHTSTLNESSIKTSLSLFDGVWCVPASPYANTEGALTAIRFARELDTPFLGTCGGFQHAMIEIARNLSQYKDADHAEINPHGSFLLIEPLACPLVEQSGVVNLIQGTRLRDIYGAAQATEGYHCRYGLNPKYETILTEAGLVVSARDDAGEVRGVELPSHRFFFAMLFQPERSAFKETVHPLILEFLKSCALTNC